jgi:heterodisulfide reductase subunit A-like polyferredoxin
MDAVDRQTLNEVAKSVASIDKNLAVHMKSFADHVKADELIVKRIEPLEVHSQRAMGVVKFIGAVCLIGGTVAGIVAAFK